MMDFVGPNQTVQMAERHFSCFDIAPDIFPQKHML